MSWHTVTNFKKVLIVGGWSITAEMRSKDSFCGRFGGGWDWKLGFQASSPGKYGWSIIFSLLVMSISINYKSKVCASLP